MILTSYQLFKLPVEPIRFPQIVDDCEIMNETPKTRDMLDSLVSSSFLSANAANFTPICPK